MAGGGEEFLHQRTHPRLGVQQGKGETLGETVVVEHEGMEGNAASAFPVHLGTGKPVGFRGLILCPWSLPPAGQNPSPTPTPPTRAPPLHSAEVEVFSTSEVLYTSAEALLPTCCLSPSAHVLGRGPAPRLNVTPPRSCPTLKRHSPTRLGTALPKTLSLPKFHLLPKFHPHSQGFFFFCVVLFYLVAVVSIIVLFFLI